MGFSTVALCFGLLHTLREMKTQLDETDIQLLNLLQRDGRITNADLAKAVGLSAPSVLQRVRALEKAGIIKDYVTVLDAEKLGRKLTAFINVSLSLHESQPIERFRKAVGEIPEVIEVYNITGDYDFMLKVQCRDMRQYEAILRDKITKIRGIGKLNTSFVLATSKQTQEIPL
jgi:Lrp/AsnC family transcriptional regulator, leucine-responsive regulatory protein